MTITKAKFQKFTIFEDLTVEFSPGINIILGKNATGKTHIMKAIYAACDITATQDNPIRKITNVFLSSGKKIGRLVKHSANNGSFEISRILPPDDRTISIKMLIQRIRKPYMSGSLKSWQEIPMKVAYIPSKDILANSPGFLSEYQLREVHFEETDADILRKVFLPPLRSIGEFEKVSKMLEDIMGGVVINRGEEFFLKNKENELEFSLLAESYRKLGLLWLLIQNGIISKNSILLWDEPETGLGPELIKRVVEILLELQHMGVQIFLTTHSNVFLDEFNLRVMDGKEDEFKTHRLYRDPETKEIKVCSLDHYIDTSP